MKKFKRFIFLFTAVILSGCNWHKIPIEICNHADKDFNQVQVITTDGSCKTEIILLKKTNCKTLTLNTKNVAPMDGSYALILEGKKNQFGYYTNGYPTEEKIDINIFSADSIEYKIINRPY